MRHVRILLVMLVTLFIFCENVEAAAVPISEDEFDEWSIERLIDYAKDYDVPCNIYGGKYYTDKGVRYWTANFGKSNKNIIKFKLNKDNYVSWATITRSMPKPTKNSFEEYRMETVTAIQEICAVSEGITEKIIGFYSDEEENFFKTFSNELLLGFQKIYDQVEQGKTIAPYDHTSAVFIKYIKKNLNLRVYWSETQIFIAITAES